MRNFLVVSLAAVAAAAHAGTLLGIDNSKLYKIDSTSGVATAVGNLLGSGASNGLAYDPATDRAVYQRNGKLYAMNVTTGASTNLNTTIFQTSAAAWYKGAYYYMGDGDGKLYKMSFSGGLPTVSTLVKDFDNKWWFGDIAISSKGILYGSSGTSVFSIDLTQPTLTVTNISSHGVQSQVGLIGNTLYGIATGNAPGGTAGQMFTLSGLGAVPTGTIAKYNGVALKLQDAASVQAVPEPATIGILAAGGMGLIRRRRKVAGR